MSISSRCHIILGEKKNVSMKIGLDMEGKTLVTLLIESLSYPDPTTIFKCSGTGWREAKVPDLTVSSSHP